MSVEPKPEVIVSPSQSPAPRMSRAEEEARSLDTVQRVIISALLGVVFGSLAAVLGAYLALAGERDLARGDVLGLWVMTGVVGVVTAAAVLLVNRRKPYAPWVVLGLLPMTVTAFWIF